MPIVPSHMTKPTLHNGALVYTPIHPTYKQYNIGVPEPGGNHQLVSKIYQDLIPDELKSISRDFSSLSLRLETYDVIRGNVLGAKDGEDIDVSKNVTDKNQMIRSRYLRTCKNLMSHVTLNELNPYKKSKNAYQDLPDRMLLYRTAYPLQYINGAVKRNTEGVSLNARMYDLNFAEYNHERLEGLHWNNFNVWREIKYYEHIKNQVLKTMESPNFVMMYGYFISMNSNVPFDKLKSTKSPNDQHRRILRDELDETILKNKHLHETVKRIYRTNYELDKDGHGLQETYETILTARHNPAMPLTAEQLEEAMEYLKTRLDILKNPDVTDEEMKISSHADAQRIISVIDSNAAKDKKKYNRDSSGNISHNGVVIKPEELEPQARERQIELLDNIHKSIMTHACNKCLVALTESPSYNLMRWCTNDITIKGLVHEMKQTGYHSPATWMSILFQVCHIFTVLQKHQIIVSRMTMDNFFIKESTEKYKPPWLYRVNGVEYYVPNQGYLVMFDSKYRDADIEPSRINPDINNIMMHGNIFGGPVTPSNTITPANHDYTQAESDLEINTQFRYLVNTNTFGAEFIKKGGIIPDEIKKAITDIQDDGRLSIIDYFFTHFSDFLNFKVGTIVPDNEAVMGYEANSQYRQGELVAYLENNDQYRYVIYKEAAPSNPHRCTILYRDGRQQVFEKQIGNSSLRKINKKHKSEQRGDGKVNHNSEVYSI